MMKKIFLISLVLLMAVLCISCEKDAKKDEDEGNGIELILPGTDEPGGVVLPEDVFE